MSPSPKSRIPSQPLACGKCSGPIFGAACLAATCTGVRRPALAARLDPGRGAQGPADHPWYAIGANIAELVDLVATAGDPSRSRAATRRIAGFQVGIAGSLWLLGLVAVIGIPIGVGAGVYLEEYAPPGPAAIDHSDQYRQSRRRAVDRLRHPGPRPLRARLRDQGAGAGPDAPLAGVLTLSLLILPIIVITTQEALRAVPQSLRQAALALGATAGRWSATTSFPRPCRVS